MAEFKVKLRVLGTPQTTNKGRVRKDKDGKDVFTTYVDMSNNVRKEMYTHMRTYLKIVCDISLKDLMNIMDITEKTQQDKEPIAYNWLQRIEVVSNRLNDKEIDMTTGVVDMYNSVIRELYTAIGAKPAVMQYAMVDLKL